MGGGRVRGRGEGRGEPKGVYKTKWPGGLVEGAGWGGSLLHRDMGT